MGLLLDFSRLELVAVMGAISLVLVAEMMNTAIEAAIDAVVTTYHPLVKIAKDVAAGAVLVATVNALAVAYFVFYDRLTDGGHDLLGGVRRSPDPPRGGGDDRDRHRGDRDQGLDRPRHPAARRPAVGPRGQPPSRRGPRSRSSPSPCATRCWCRRWPS